MGSPKPLIVQIWTECSSTTVKIWKRLHKLPFRLSLCHVNAFYQFAVIPIIDLQEILLCFRFLIFSKLHIMTNNLVFITSQVRMKQSLHFYLTLLIFPLLLTIYLLYFTFLVIYMSAFTHSCCSYSIKYVFDTFKTCLVANLQNICAIFRKPHK